MLRVIDFGPQPPLRSQTVWHAVAYGVSAGGPPTLSFVRPAAPYVSVGYHRRLDEVDVEACRRAHLPVFRRMIGGGPVLLDRDQLFFQITVPIDDVPASRPAAMRMLLAPAVAAFQDVGVPAEFDDRVDIVVDGAKISGVGGGQIEDAAIAVGNLIEGFDHDQMANLLALDDQARTEVLRLMRRHVHPTPADAEAFKAACVRRYTEAFGARPVAGELTDLERAHLFELDARFVNPAWLKGPERPLSDVRCVKVRSGVWVADCRRNGTHVVASVMGDRLERLVVHAMAAQDDARELERALAGRTLEEAAAAARGFGGIGVEVSDLIGSIDGRRA